MSHWTITGRAVCGESRTHGSEGAERGRPLSATLLIQDLRNNIELCYTLHSALVLTHFGIFTTNPCHERIRTG